MKTDKQTWQEKFQDFYFEDVCSLALNVNKLKALTNWIDQNKELIGQEGEINQVKKYSEQYRKGFTQCLKEVKEFGYDVIAKYDKKRIAATQSISQAADTPNKSEVEGEQGSKTMEDIIASAMEDYVIKVVHSPKGFPSKDEIIQRTITQIKQL